MIKKWNEKVEEAEVTSPQPPIYGIIHELLFSSNFFSLFDTPSSFFISY